MPLQHQADGTLAENATTLPQVQIPALEIMS